MTESRITWTDEDAERARTASERWNLYVELEREFRVVLPRLPAVETLVAGKEDHDILSVAALREALTADLGTGGPWHHPEPEEGSGGRTAAVAVEDLQVLFRAWQGVIRSVPTPPFDRHQEQVALMRRVAAAIAEARS